MSNVASNSDENKYCVETISISPIIVFTALETTLKSTVVKMKPITSPILY